MLFFGCKAELLYGCAKIIHSEAVNNSNIREIKSAVDTVWSYHLNLFVGGYNTVLDYILLLAC